MHYTYTDIARAHSWVMVILTNSETVTVDLEIIERGRVSAIRTCLRKIVKTGDFRIEIQYIIKPLKGKSFGVNHSSVLIYEWI